MVKKIGKVLFWWIFLNWIPYNISEAMLHISRKTAGERGDPRYKGYQLDSRWVWLRTIDNLKEVWNNTVK